MPYFRIFHVSSFSRCPAVCIPFFALLALGCDERTPEEKGQDYADEKLGFIEGAAEQLSERGKGIGTSLGKGVGELVKGTGSAVKDVVHPPVNVSLSAQTKPLGLSIGQATEGSDGVDNREVVIHLSATKPYSGKLSLSAFENESARKAKKASAVTVSPLVDIVPGKSSVVRFQFDSSVRLSKMEQFELTLEASKQLKLDEKVTAQKIKLQQLTETKTPEGLEVSLYAIFEQPFRDGFSLRAYDAQGTEIGRSTPLPALDQAADSAGYVAFQFDKRTPVDKIATYKITVDTNAKPAKP